MRSLLLVASIALLASVAHGASMVRFINAVPPKANFEPFQTAYNAEPQNPANQEWPTNPTANPVGVHPFGNTNKATYVNADRIGFEYFPSTRLKQATVVWTEPVDVLAAAAARTTDIHRAPFYFLNALPAIRPYHANTIGGATIPDRVTLTAHMSSANNFGRQSVNDEASTGCSAIPAAYDCLDQSALKLEGIPGYISFAAGSYRLRAFGVLPDVPAAGDQWDQASSTAFAESVATFNFEDNSLYTIVATGTWTHTGSASTSSDVQLVLIKESTAVTDFGKAAIRFFNALSYNTNADSGAVEAVDVYQGPTVSDSTRIVSNLDFRSVSEYVSVNPGSTVFPLADKSLTALAPTTDSVTVNLPAGTRATSFCSTKSVSSKTNVFCRIIPTRVVAYVRLVADTGSLPTLVNGKFGPQKLSETNLNVFQSIDYPLMEYVEEQYALAGSAPGQNGLYPVLGDVAPGSVSGYGEVTIPLFIHDSATAPTIGYSCFSTSANLRRYGGMCSNLSPDEQQQVGHATQIGSANIASTFKYSARYKRVNLFVKTDGYATLTARYEDTQADTAVYYTTAGNANRETNEVGGTIIDQAARFARFTAIDLTRAGPFIDRYMEPGEYYSMYVKACDRTYVVSNQDGGTTAPTFRGHAVRANGVNTQLPGIKCPYLDLSASDNRGYLKNSALPDAIPAPDSLLFGWSLDMDRTTAANGFEGSSSAMIQITPFDSQNFDGTLSLTKQTTDNNPIRLDITVPRFSKNTAWDTAATGTNPIHAGAATVTATAAGYFDSARLSTWTKNHDESWRPANTWTSIPAGTYTYTYTQNAARGNTVPEIDNCVDMIPTTTEFEIKAGMRYTLYVLNSYGCAVDGSPETSKLEVKIVPLAAACTEGTGGVSQHCSTTESTSFFNGNVQQTTGVATFSAASAVSANLVVLFAAVFGLVALLF